MSDVSPFLSIDGKNLSSWYFLMSVWTNSLQPNQPIKPYTSHSVQPKSTNLTIIRVEKIHMDGWRSVVLARQHFFRVMMSAENRHHGRIYYT